MLLLPWNSGVVSKPFPGVEQKAEEEQTLHSFVKGTWKSNHFLSTIQVGNTLITILSGGKIDQIHLDRGASWDVGDGETAYAIISFLSLAFLTYISIVFGELYPKRVALNLRMHSHSLCCSGYSGLGKIVSPLSSLLSASGESLESFSIMTAFDDAQWKNDREDEGENWGTCWPKVRSFGYRAEIEIFKGSSLTQMTDRREGEGHGCLGRMPL